MSATGSSLVPEHDESPSSDVSPLTMGDGSTSKLQYFSPLNSPRLDSIPEIHEQLGPPIKPVRSVEAKEPFPVFQQQAETEADKEKTKEKDGGKVVEVKRPEGLERRVSASSISFKEPVMPGRAVRIEKAKKMGIGKPKPRKDRIRGASPPAPSRFQHHVSFDNFSGGEPTEKNPISFTLNSKHKGYTYKKRSRTFMVGIDENDYSDYALRWMLEELVDDGDEIVCLRVVDKDAKISSDKSLEKKQYQEEAKNLMDKIQVKNDENRAVSIVLEFAVGKVHSTFQKMIELYEPCMLIVGTRGRSLGGFQGLVSNRNSFSKWCLQYSPIPVVVVRPTEKRDKKKMKRINDPTRQSYLQILSDSSLAGGHEANSTPRGSVGEIELLPALSTEKEAHEVAAALGLPARFDPTIKVARVRYTRKASETSTGSQDSAPSSPGEVMKSPKIRIMDSPAVSDDESGDDSEAEFDAVPGHILLEQQSVEKQMKLHEMEQGEAAALASRRDRIGSVDSSIDAEEGSPDRQEDGEGGEAKEGKETNEGENEKEAKDGKM